MMNQRLTYLIIGCVIGFILGYIVRSIREIKDRVEEVDEHVLKAKKDDGFIQTRLATNIGLILVVAFTLWAAISSQLASNKVKDTQHEQDNLTACNQTYQLQTINALNARTANSQAQTDANVALQKAQATFLGIFFVNPPATADQRADAFQTYFDALNAFIVASAKTTANVSMNPYPTSADFINCIHRK